MADSQKKEALDALATVLAGATGINTVVIANASLDMDLKTEAQVPLAEIIPVTEMVDYEKGYVAMWRPLAVVTVYFLADDEDEAARENVRQAVLNAIGADSTLGGNCADCRVQTINNGGSFPLFAEIFNLEISFERHIANA